MKLNELAEKYNTDKQFKDHNYVKMYETMLKTIDVNSLLEIGLGNGASLKMWLEYYKNKNIYCIEYFDEENKTVWNGADGNIEGLHLIKGDSRKIETWNSVPYGLDVIIDDGDHHPETQIETFKIGFSRLRSGGLYFIEDLHCNFEKIYTDGKDVIYSWLFGMIIAQQTPGANLGGNFYAAKPFISDPLAREIYSYRFYKSVIVFEKA